MAILDGVMKELDIINEKLERMHELLEIVKADFEAVQIRAAELQRAPVHSEQKCPQCKGTGIYLGIVGVGHRCVNCDGTGISNRSDGG